jgi:hypothetical protein
VQRPQVCRRGTEFADGRAEMKIASCILIMLIATWRPIKTTPTEARDFMLDQMGNFYLIFNSHIERQNVTGTGQFRTSDLVYGNIEYLDVTNSLKPFIYYKSIGKIVNLDNTLSEQGSGIDLKKDLSKWNL